MSLTSYRAAPPRDKPLHALRENRWRNGLADAPGAPNFCVPKRLPEKANPGLASRTGCGGYVPTPTRFGKGLEAAFFDFMTSQNRRMAPKTARSCQKFRKGPASPAIQQNGETPWTSPSKLLGFRPWMTLSMPCSMPRAPTARLRLRYGLTA